MVSAVIPGSAECGVDIDLGLVKIATAASPMAEGAKNPPPILVHWHAPGPEVHQ